MLKEMKLMDLAKMVNEMKVGDVIDFVNKNADEAEWYGGFCGVKRIDEFDNDNPMYLVSRYCGQAECKLYHLNELDPEIGDFCEKRLNRYKNGMWVPPTEKDWIECCAKMIADYLENKDGGVCEMITVDIEVGK